MLLFEVLTYLLQTGYDTLSFQTRLLHFGVVLRHLFQINLETLQIIMCFPVQLVELKILLLQVFSFPNILFCFFQLIGDVLVLMLDPIHLPLDYDQFFVMILQCLLCCL
jgi:hypothetical protein